MKTVTTSRDLGQAIKNGEQEIRVEGDLCKRVIKIRSVKPIFWGIVAGSIAAGVALLLATPAVTVATAPVGGIGGVISFKGSIAVSSAAATILGIKATIVALGVAVGAGGGTAALVKLRDNYSVDKKNSNCIVLKKK